MKLMDVANELVAGCRENRELANLDKLYAKDAVSVEAMDMGNGREITGVEGIKAKHAWFDSMYEILGGEVSDPFPHGDDRFAVTFEMNAKSKETGEMEVMKEVAVYHVADGKIVREEFFYAGE
ncbi:ketosteroid isomerase-like protein [Litoreibacter halocynthiae]|uniref:Ketosteroid isomerase-like protein n=1 Tax=Litoreibacter halocynthiae TaxID=1242689 RepID=A0A4R7LLD4_9RHOB|nr:nuclear transport factor 2 family protein [Litoreibacter halocynthiae]TDT74920.1 ketosteroid isomerase-like protein [Litoreibacter halocynthiae]